MSEQPTRDPLIDLLDTTLRAKRRTVDASVTGNGY